MFLCITWVCARMLILCTSDLELIAEHSRCLSIALQSSHFTRVIIRDKCQTLTATPEIAPLTLLLLRPLLPCALRRPIYFVPQPRKSAFFSEIWGGSVSGHVEREQFPSILKKASALTVTHLLCGSPCVTPLFPWSFHHC